MMSKSKKIKTKGTQIVSVPNDAEGQAFLKQFSKYANFNQYILKKHGRGGGGKYTRDTPLDKAKWIALYFYDKKAWEKAQADYKRRNVQKNKMIDAVKGILQNKMTYADYVEVEPLIDQKVEWM